MAANCAVMYTVLYMSTTRTQIYITEDQRRRLDELRRRDGVSLAALIRAAIDAYLAGTAPDPHDALDATFGQAASVTVPSRDEWVRGRPAN